MTMTRKRTIQHEAIKTMIHVARLEDDASWFLGFATFFIWIEPDTTGMLPTVASGLFSSRSLTILISSFTDVSEPLLI